ncbi:MAG TPA: hypothetical protein VEU06_09475 [Micropepsaceae bacterium]|jgi:hypothetical protein|nr:hypothetical protein [Micropepsaceae bacterium]
MKTKLLVSVLLLSAAAITPSYANYFSNPRLGINLNVGSAPSPTPQDIREDRQPIVTEDVDDSNTTVAAQPAPAKTATTDQKTAQPAAGNARTAQSSPSR